MIGNKIKSIRISLGLSQKDFGEKCGISDASICEWETGKKEPSYQSIQKIISAYKVNPSVFFEANGGDCNHSETKK